MKLELDHLEGCGMSVTQEVPDKSAIVAWGLCTGPIGYSRGLNHISITAHVSNHPCKSIAH
jgi:hypothetical protein